MLVTRIKERKIVEARHSEQVDEILVVISIVQPLTVQVGMMSIVTTVVKRGGADRLEIGRNYGMIHELYYNDLFALKTGPGLHAPPKCKTRPSRYSNYYN